MRNYTYVHLDQMSNSVLSRGITHRDFYNYTLHRPQNILLLNGDDRSGDYEIHTGFRVVRGAREVDNYLAEASQRISTGTKWIDFEEYDVLQRLTANEIAELLYFGHMNSQLSSPFFYKLQNNYAFFEVNDKTTKIYFRNIENFYRILSEKLTNQTDAKLNSSVSFFRKKIDVLEIPEELINRLKLTMQEGVVFDTAQVGLKNGFYHIPIYIVEDNLRKLDQPVFKTEEQIGILSYDSGHKKWSLQKEQFDSFYALS
ncbi:hypothetical protein ACWOAH_03065 [Vagococcus vulneris]|uniref:Uncharacterized protein n=1 Tax=Vagococcus vulneris TaxID=1977869 RepID=A0A429ZXG0_9ENTE|nr:hypothetical protein [Vagococcus vulneris]RST98581.1 hypothetical protein CBF37_07340 [Vagococcus vulneris]